MKLNRLSSAIAWRLRQLNRDRIRGLLELRLWVPPFDGMQNYARMKFLYRCVLEHAAPSSGVAVEVGCFRCSSTVFLAKACLRKGISNVYAIDLFTGTPGWNMKTDSYAKAQARLSSYGLDTTVTLIRSHSLHVAWDKPIDVLHIDADHEYEAVKKDIDKYVPHLSEGGIVIFDDYDAFHPGVKRAVHELLLERGDFEVVGIHYEGDEYGSICLRKMDHVAVPPVATSARNGASQ